MSGMNTKEAPRGFYAALQLDDLVGCRGCAFFYGNPPSCERDDYDPVSCAARHRKDKHSVIFIKKQKAVLLKKEEE